MSKPELRLVNKLSFHSNRLNFQQSDSLARPRGQDRRLLRFALLIGMLFFAFCYPSLVRAAQVTLAWDANDPSPDGYCLYQRAGSSAYDYEQPAWSGSGTTCTISNLDEGSQYHFVVRAYVADSESGDSNEVSYYAEPAEPTPVNNAPTARTGSDQTILGGTIVMLDGRMSSDPDGDSLSYAWSQTGGPSVTLSGRNTTQPTFTAPAGTPTNTVLTFQLLVTDPGGLSDSDTCRITIPAVIETNDPPVAEAGTNQTVISGAGVTLDGSGSTDPEGQTLIYQWRQTSGTAVQLASANRARASFTAPQVNAGQQATLIFELTVSDDRMLTCTDTCIVQVNPAPVADRDGDGILDGQDAFPDDPSEWIDTDGDRIGNNADPDDDNDGMPDTWETQFGFNPLLNDAGGDSDQDGLSNVEEYENGSDPLNAEENQAPDRPRIVSPSNGATGVSLRARISASAFSDPDSGDEHKKSQWRIVNASNQRVVMDIQVYRYLTTVWLPYFLLDPGRTYTCQVKYFDQNGLDSEWSSPVSFTTASNTYWWNSRGLVEGEEAPTSTDLNANGISDATETETIKSVLAVDGQHTMAVAIDPNTNAATIDGAGAIDPYAETVAPQAQDIGPFGLIGYRIQLAQPGQSTAVSLYFSSEVDPSTSWVTMSSDGDYPDCSESVVHQTDGSIVRQLTDGGEDDLDGVANGVIIDAVGPRALSSDDQSLDDGTASSSSGGGGGGGCFIRSLLK